MRDWKQDAAREILQIQPDLNDSVYTQRDRIAAIISKYHEQITKPEPGHIWDWAAKAGVYLHAEGVKLSSHRIAAVISHFAEPLVKLLNGARRKHKTGCDYLTHPKLVAGLIVTGEPCTCGADEWNKKIDAALHGE